MSSNKSYVIEMNYLKEELSGESNESIYERFGTSMYANGVVEWAERNTLRWFGHSERMKNKKFVKKSYLSETEYIHKKR